MNTLISKLAERSTSRENVESFQWTIMNIINPDWENGPWVAGGCIRRLLLGQDPFESDIDVFFADPEQKDQWIATIKNRFPDAKVSVNEHNVTIDCGENLKLQAVHINYYSSPEEVIDSFDYTICQLITDGTYLAVGEFTLWDLARKRLVVHKLEYPVASMRRMVKYTKQGFYMCPGAMTDFLKRVIEKPQSVDANLPKYID